MYAKFFVSAFVTFSVVATQAAAQSKPNIEEIYVTGGKDGIRTLTGSGTLVDREAIKTFDRTDLNALLAQVPGVYIREEDGYGLRPNIGLRGATSDRSQKITLMEDGILISPSPYSAPAAYYVPNVNRMEALEVLKGPAAIRHGPHTVGGAVNFVTRAIPDARTGEAALTLGSDQYYNGRLFYGDQGPQHGYWIEALSYGANGFKDLPSGDTGFRRNDVNAKWRWMSSSDDPRHTVEVKVGYADEDSDETYLGLSDADFERDPNRRYIASEQDQFTSEHLQIHARHSLKINDAWSLQTRVYANRFERDWARFDGFFPPEPVLGEAPPSATSVGVVLANPVTNRVQFGLLNGTRDSNGRPEQTLIVINNDREYGSQGIDVNGKLEASWGEVQHRFEVGVRFHQDYVERDHVPDGYQVQQGRLVFDGIGRQNTDLNRSESDALAAYVYDEMSWGKWKWNAGVRVESIDNRFDNELNGVKNDTSENIVIPGAGVFYQWTDALGFLVGVNKGFSPVGPDTRSPAEVAAGELEAEDSVNIEYGMRYRTSNVNIDAVGFFNDYSNFIGRCRASDFGCDDDAVFSGGAIEISGLEFSGSYFHELNGGWTLPLSWTYTYTQAFFQESFESDFAQWGIVEQGDAIPYTPEHQLSLQFGLETLNWSFNWLAKYRGEMFENRGEPASGPDDVAIEPLLTHDLSMAYQFNPDTKVRLVANNILDEQEIVSRRPFGARPNHPRAVRLGVTYDF